MQRYTDISENTNIEDSRQLLLDNDQSGISNNSGVSFPSYGEVGTACYRTDQDRLYIKRSNGNWQMIADATETALSREDADARYSLSTHNHDSKYAPRVSNNRPGVDRIYRSDSDNGYNVQINYTGTYWRLHGYNGNTEHAGVLVERATSASTADNATKLNNLSASSYLRSNANDTFNGTLTVTGNLKVNSTLTVTGDITSASDARIKTNIETLENSLETVKKLRGVSYRHKKTGKDSIGFVAQEMKEVLPCLVHADEDEKLSVAYGNVTALLVEAIKDLTARIERMEAA